MAVLADDEMVVDRHPDGRQCLCDLARDVDSRRLALHRHLDLDRPGRFADEGVLLNDPAFGDIDNFQTANALAKAIEKLGGADLVLMGRASADWDMGVVPTGVGQLLNIPVVTVAKSARSRVSRRAMRKNETPAATMSRRSGSSDVR